MKIKVSPKLVKVDMSNPRMIKRFDCKVHAGNPMEILDAQVDWASMNEYLNVNKDDIIYSLDVVGDSMRGSGIFDGDVAFCNADKEPNNGDLVVANVNGEYSLKEFHRREDGHISLVPTNPRYKSIEVDSSMYLDVVGVVVNVMKNNFR